MQPKDVDSFDFSSNLPKGTFVIAYGTDTKGQPTVTAFTNAGLLIDSPKPIPEPSTLAIAGLGALGFVGYGLRRRLKK
jgi:hypothetical protein